MIWVDSFFDVTQQIIVSFCRAFMVGQIQSQHFYGKYPVLFCITARIQRGTKRLKWRYR